MVSWTGKLDRSMESKLEAQEVGLTINHSEPGTEVRGANGITSETRVPAGIRKCHILQHQYLRVCVLVVGRLMTNNTVSLSLSNSHS